jgi:hypothetical protein
MESGVYFGVESGVTFGVVFFLILFKNAFCFITKIVIIIFCLLKVLFDGLTTLKSMAEVNGYTLCHSGHASDAVFVLMYLTVPSV